MKSEFKRLVEQEKHFKRALQMVNLGYWYWVPTTNELVWSDESYLLVGQERNRNKTPDMQMFMQNIHPDDQAYVQEKLATAMESDSVPDLQYRVIREYDEITVRARAELIRGDDESSTYLFGTVQDITAEVKQHSMLKKANQAKDDFLSSMSHELRTPLNAIMGFAQLLGMDELNSNQKENVNEIIHAGTHLIGLINDVLDLAEIESGSFNISVRPVLIKETIEACVSLLQPMTIPLSIKMETNIEELNQKVFKVDPIRLKQILLNLLSNAIKYNKPNGQVTLSVKQIQDHIQFIIEDTGIGIDEVNRKNLFIPFDRLGHENGVIPGSGVGLGITKKIVEAMSGNIDFESSKGKGSSFWVNFPGSLEQIDNKDSNTIIYE